MSVGYFYNDGGTFKQISARDFDYTITSENVPAVGSGFVTGGTLEHGVSEGSTLQQRVESLRSCMGTTTTSDGTWWSFISNRHRNGSGDGKNYGTLIYTPLTNNDTRLYWCEQSGPNLWGAVRTFIDSSNPEIVCSATQPTNPQAMIWIKE